MAEGGCRCGAVRYEVDDIIRNSICHCHDCQHSAGAPMVEWMLVEEAALMTTKGEVATYESSPGAFRSFCPTCGTGLFYRNQGIFPGKVDVQTATLDNPADAPAPTAQVQLAERREWVERMQDIKGFERYPDE